MGNSKGSRNKNEYDYEINSNYNEVKSGKSQLCKDTQTQHLMYCQSICVYGAKPHMSLLGYNDKIILLETSWIIRPLIATLFCRCHVPHFRQGGFDGIPEADLELP